jgi:tetratricopeptide (TPR) repeat protein
MTSLRDALLQGWRHQRAGQLAQAEHIYRQILEVQPDHPEALYLLGTICQRLGKLDDAAQHLLMAVSCRPDYAEAHNNLGVVMILMGRRLDAIHHFRHVVRLRPSDPEALNNLGNALREEGMIEEAVELLNHALRLKPDFPDAMHNLGLALSQLDRPAEACEYLREAVRRRPDFADAHCDLGLVFAKMRRWDEAAESFQQFIRLRPDRAEGYAHLGSVLRELGRLEESADRLHQAIRLNPEDANLRSSLGLTLQQLGQLAEAEEHLRIALSLAPDHADAHNNLAITLAQMGRFPAAIEHYDRAIELKPDQPIYRRNRALAYLTIGDFLKGWADYEYRWHCPGFVETQRQYPAARWQGEPLHGKSILLYWEQGLGDTIQLARYGPILKSMGAAKVFLEVQPPLVRLLSRLEGVDRVVRAGDQVEVFDYQAPLGSVPGILQTTPASIPAPVPYLSPEPERLAFWRSQIATTPELKIGIAWQGNPKQGGDRLRSIPLVHFAALARIPGVQLFSLQKEVGLEQLRELSETVPIVDLGRRLDLSGGAFLDTAAVMKCLDLVVTCDTAIGHLAGALGVPVWVALSAAADWRWLLDRDDTPWYPTMRLFRQSKLKRWDDVFDRITAEIRKLRLAAPQAHSIPIEVSPAELIDKITILQIKQERIRDEQKLRNVRHELGSLLAAWTKAVPISEELDSLVQELRQVNEKIWDLEDALRRHEAEQRFDAEFIDLARSVYRTNDRRATLKRRINEMLASNFIEEKEHPHYELTSPPVGYP